MLSYDEWNSAFLTYFLGGASRGTNIYLSTDDDTIEAIGEDLLNLPKGDALRDFGRAVRMRVVREGYRVNAESVYGRLEHGVPRGLAFLCCLVLAASNMSDEATADVNIDSNNYFRRLREILDLPRERGRPSGMSPGVEEPVWHEWNSYLLESGFLSTARGGPDGPRKFIHFPMSQALLRRADKDSLGRLFNAKHWTNDWARTRCLAR